MRSIAKKAITRYLATRLKAEVSEEVNFLASESIGLKRKTVREESIISAKKIVDRPIQIIFFVMINEKNRIIFVTRKQSFADLK